MLLACGRDSQKVSLVALHFPPTYDVIDLLIRQCTGLVLASKHQARRFCLRIRFHSDSDFHRRCVSYVARLRRFDFRAAKICCALCWSCGSMIIYERGTSCCAEYNYILEQSTQPTKRQSKRRKKSSPSCWPPQRRRKRPNRRPPPR